MYDTKIKLQIVGEECFFGPGVAELMEKIAHEGSMKGACASMGMSYSKGWHMINRAEKELHTELIVRNHGGRQGGNCCLTADGERFLAQYRKMEAAVSQYAAQVYADYFDEC